MRMSMISLNTCKVTHLWGSAPLFRRQRWVQEVSEQIEYLLNYLHKKKEKKGRKDEDREWNVRSEQREDDHFWGDDAGDLISYIIFKLLYAQGILMAERY